MAWKTETLKQAAIGSTRVTLFLITGNEPKEVHPIYGRSYYQLKIDHGVAAEAATFGYAEKFYNVTVEHVKSIHKLTESLS